MVSIPQKPVMDSSRVFDDDSLFLGLTYSDLLVGTVLITQSHRILLPYGHELYAFVIGALFFGGMAHLRLHTRKKMILDFISFYFIPFRRRFQKIQQGKVKL